MSFREIVSPPDKTAAPPGSGCLSGFAVPPLAVVLVSLVIAFVSLGGHAPSLAPLTSGTQLGELATPSPRTLAPFFMPAVQYWAASIQAWSQEAGLDPNLVATVMQIESCGNPFARSSAGAEGLFQVMPDHFLATDDPIDPGTNARRGLAYLKRSFQAAAGDPRLALAGYNGGIAIIHLSEISWADETQRYAYWGDGIYEDTARGASTSPHLLEWLAAGGESLCLEAQRVLGLNP